MAKIVLDNLGRIYICLAVTWTIVLACGMSFLYINRLAPFLKIRRLPLVFASLSLLHVYFVLCMTAYIIGPMVTCQVEYFLMSIYLPLGIAVFQAANSQFLHIATQQSKFTNMTSLDDPAAIEHRRSRDYVEVDGIRNLFRLYKHSSKVAKMTVWIAFGMVLQLVVTLVVYLISEKFHPGFGLVPVRLIGSLDEQRAACSRGWEWWASIVWQFFWAWLYAPWLLFKSRNIKDTHGWRLQTILCCIAGLPASPLWLTSLYCKKMAVVNQYFPPPMWFGFSIFLLQLFSIFIPCWKVFTHRALQQETLDAIAVWERRNDQHSSIFSAATTNVPSHSPSGSASSFQTLVALESNPRKSTADTQKETMLTMAALEHALRWSPEPLQKFAALKDFTGENISFLTHVADWKRTWKLARLPNFSLPSEQLEARSKKRRQQFNKAIRIYAAFVSMRYAEFPINLCAKQFMRLEDMFDQAASVLYGSNQNTQEQTLKAEIAPFAFPDVHDKAALVTKAELDRDDLVWYWGPVPDSFDETVFDSADKEMRYLVLTNTWPKFVHEGWSENCEPSIWAKMNRSWRNWRRSSSSFY